LGDIVVGKQLNYGGNSKSLWNRWTIDSDSNRELHHPDGGFGVFSL
jgi:hypothetical protein